MSSSLQYSDLSNTSSSLDSGGRSLVSRSSLDTAEVGQEAGVGGASEIARVGERVDGASTADVLLASSSSGAVVDGEQAATGGSVFDGCLDTETENHIVSWDFFDTLISFHGVRKDTDLENVLPSARIWAPDEISNAWPVLSSQ